MKSFSSFLGGEEKMTIEIFSFPLKSQKPAKEGHYCPFFHVEKFEFCVQLVNGEEKKQEEEKRNVARLLIT